MPDSESGGCELVKDLRIARGVVAFVVAVLLQLQPVETDGVPTQQSGQELVVSDVLVLGDHDPPGVLEQLLVFPMRIHSSQSVDEAVVFPHENRVDHC